MNTPKTIEVIQKLKVVKEEKSLTVAEIARRVNASGSYVSETVVRRVFAKGSEDNDSFIYDQSIQPIAKVLLSDDVTTAEAEAALSIIGLKNEQLEERDTTIKEMRLQYENMRREFEDRIRFLRGQIETKDKYMDRKDEIISRLIDELHPPKAGKA